MLKEEFSDIEKFDFMTLAFMVQMQLHKRDLPKQVRFVVINKESVEGQDYDWLIAAASRNNHAEVIVAKNADSMESQLSQFRWLKETPREKPERLPSEEIPTTFFEQTMLELLGTFKTSDDSASLPTQFRSLTQALDFVIQEGCHTQEAAQIKLFAVYPEAKINANWRPVFKRRLRALGIEVQEFAPRSK
jgi:hypothetical protein